MVINRQDTNGVKPLLQTGELGFDNFASGGDKGRVYVGAGTVNIALAKKSEVDVKVDDSEIASVNLFRADKVLASKSAAAMSYNGIGKLIKVQYTNATDVDYEVLTYNGFNKLSNVAHYIGSVLKGNTVLNYSSGKLVSAPFTAV